MRRSADERRQQRFQHVEPYHVATFPRENTNEKIKAAFAWRRTSNFAQKEFVSFLSFFVCQQDFGFGRVSTHAASPAPSTPGLKGSSQNYNASTVLAIGHTSPNTTHETPSHASTT